MLDSFGGVVYPSLITISSWNVGKTEEWNGTNWTAVNDTGLTPASDYHYYKGGGLKSESSEAAIAAGNNPYGTAVELWNGTNWSIIGFFKFR